MSSAKPFSLSLGSKKSTGPPALTPRKRPHSSLAADASDSEGEENGQPQLVSAFDSAAGGAIGGKTEVTAPLVIVGQKNRSWQDEAQRKKGKKNLLPPEEQARRDGPIETSESTDNRNDSPRTWGLVIAQKSAQSAPSETTNGNDEASPPNVVSAEKVPKTADEEALEALLSDKKKDSGLIITNTASSDDRFAPRITEGDAYKADVASRPDMASIADYAAVPIEEFGRAMMRGMGWKDGEEIGRRKGTSIKERKVERRPAALGIGAKETPEDLERLGAWGKNVKKSKKVEAHFNPMVMKNPRTGEVLTEEEYSAMKENQKLLIEDNPRERDDKTSSRDRERREERHHHEKDRDRYSDRERHRDRHRGEGKIRRRERSSSPVSRQRERDRDRTHESERDHYRDYERKGERHKDDFGRKYRTRDDDRYRSSRHRDDYDERTTSHRKHRERDDDHYRSSSKYERN